MRSLLALLSFQPLLRDFQRAARLPSRTGRCASLEFIQRRPQLGRFDSGTMRKLLHCFFALHCLHFLVL
jgi:hypothetical protein